MDWLRISVTKTFGRRIWGFLCGLLATFTLTVLIVGLGKGLVTSWSDFGVAAAFLVLFSVAAVHSYVGIPLLSDLPANFLRGTANILFALVLAPLLVPIIQFVKFLQDGVWYHLNVVNSLGYVVLKMLETGWGDAKFTPRLLDWCNEPTSWLGIHAILGWIPLTLVLFAVSFVFFGGAGLLLIEEARGRATKDPG